MYSAMAWEIHDQHTHFIEEETEARGSSHLGLRETVEDIIEFELICSVLKLRKSYTF